MIFRYSIETDDFDNVKELLETHGIEYQIDGYDRFMIASEDSCDFEDLLDDNFIEYVLI